jgi:hypothetical protein
MMSSCFEVGCGWLLEVEWMLLKEVVGVQVGFHMSRNETECHDSLIEAVYSQHV